MSSDPTVIFLWRALAIFLLVGAVSGIALSLLLIFKPHLLQRVNHIANRWVSARRINQLLDRSINIEYWFIQYHRPLGLLVTLGAGYILVYFGLLFNKPAALQRLIGYVPTRLLDGLLDAMVLASLTGAVVALFAGLLLWLRPSLLRGIEDHTNQWVSSRRATKSLEMPRDQVERFVARHARRTGWLLLLGSIYLLLTISRLLV